MVSIGRPNVTTTQHVIEACGGKYAGLLGAIVELVDGYLAILECMNKDKDDWLDANSIFCFELLMLGLIGMILCGQVILFYCHC